MAKSVKWGVIGLGSIANRVLKGFQATPPDATQVVAVGSRNAAKAAAFAKTFGIPKSYDSYEGVIADKNVDLVYVALPNHLHKPWTLKAIAAGKHVLCEKPFAMNLKEAAEMVAAAKKKGVFLMEAFMYRCHPQMALIKETVRKGAIGQVRMIKAGFAYGGINDDNTRMALAEGGGGLMDVGCYPVSFCRMVAGEDPVEVHCTGVLGKKSKVDEWAAGIMRFPGGAVAHFDCGMMVNTDWTATIYGTLGRIHVTSPWIPEPNDAKLEITLDKDGKTKTVAVPAKHYFANEAETVARCILGGKLQAEEMIWADTLGNMNTLDALRKSLGLAWPGEKKGTKPKGGSRRGQ